MLKTVLYEDSGWRNLLPLVYFRPVYDLRCGMRTLHERALSLLDGGPLELWCRESLATMVAEHSHREVNAPSGETTLFLNGRGLWKTLPRHSDRLPAWVGVTGPEKSIACIFADEQLASQLSPAILLDATRARSALAGLPRIDVSDCVDLCDWPWQLVHANPAALAYDWKALRDRLEIPRFVPPGVHLLEPHQIRIGSGTRIKPCVVIDAEAGPVWIDERVTIQPHTYIQGPAYIGPDCVLQAGTKLREATTLGPWCKVGGEVESSILLGYANKQHDGFLGHSVLGAWVNLGAGCTTSDLKNTYGSVRVPVNGREVETGELFVGTFMGDFSKAGINVAFPTGSVIGVCSSIFAPRSPKFVPSFAWIDENGVSRYDERRGLEIARKVMARRRQSLTSAEEDTYRKVRRQILALEHASQRDLEAVHQPCPA